MRTALITLAVVLMPVTLIAQIGSGATLPNGGCNTGGGSLFYLTSGDVGLYVCENDAWTKKVSPGGSASWGGISGTLSDQTDLQTALDGKQASGSYATAAQGAKADSALQPSGNGSQLTGLTKAQVGLGNVDNTSDANKPISSATQTALNAKQATLVSGTSLKTVNGTSLLGSGDVAAGGGGLPAGMITLILSGTCPEGFEEATELNGKTVIGTLAANGDVGTTGGSDSITEVLDHTHAVSVTDPGHVHVENTNSATTGGLRGSTPDTSTNTSTASGYSTASATTGITASTANPSGGVASIDNRSAFVLAIFCRKS